MPKLIRGGIHPPLIFGLRVEVEVLEQFFSQRWHLYESPARQRLSLRRWQLTDIRAQVRPSEYASLE